MNDPVATAPICPLRQRLIDDMNMRLSIPPVLVCVVAPRLSTQKIQGVSRQPTLVMYSR